MKKSIISTFVCLILCLTAFLVFYNSQPSITGATPIERTSKPLGQIFSDDEKENLAKQELFDSEFKFQDYATNKGLRRLVTIKITNTADEGYHFIIEYYYITGEKELKESSSEYIPSGETKLSIFEHEIVEPKGQSSYKVYPNKD